MRAISFRNSRRILALSTRPHQRTDPASSSSVIRTTFSLSDLGASNKLHSIKFNAVHAERVALNEPIRTRRFVSKANQKAPEHHSKELQDLSDHLAQLQEAPIGSLSIDKFHKAADLIRQVKAKHSSNLVLVDTSFQILERLVQEIQQAKGKRKRYLNHQNTHRILDTTLLQTVILKHWAKTNHPHKATKTKERGNGKTILDMIHSWNKRAPGHLQPDIAIYNTALESYLLDSSSSKYSKTKKKLSDNFPIKVAKFIQGVYQQLLLKNNNNAYPNQKTHELVIQAWIAAKDVNSATAVLTGIRNNHELQPQTTSNNIRFGKEIFEQLLKECVDEKAGQMADSVLDHIHYFHDHGLLAVRPLMEHYTQVIQAWAVSSHRHHPQAQRRLQELTDFVLNDYNNNHNHQLQPPDILTFHVILQGFARLGDLESAEDILGQLCARYRQQDSTRSSVVVVVKPDVECFGTVLDGWSRVKNRPDAGTRAEALLRLMWDSHQMVPSMQHLVPDVSCYNSVMHAYINATNYNAAGEAERLFQELQHKSTEEAYAHLQPTTETYGTLIHAWAQHGNVDQAAKILAFMCDTTTNDTAAMPDAQCFNSVMNAHAKSKAIVAGKEANRLLEKMWELHRDDRFPAAAHIRPNNITYGSVIHAWAQSGHADAGEKAERLLREMADMAKALDDDSLMPTTRTYNSVIHAWGSCGDYDRARAVFQELPSKPSNNTSVCRNVGTYNSLLLALATADEYHHDARLHKGEIADSILTAMQVRGVKPKIQTYGLAHKCWFQSSADFKKASFRLQSLKSKTEELEREEREMPHSRYGS
ncbi:Pentatricopeptide repeat-containing protein [Seminavis robusta]|uniref:Pentatricopeptide repeat-containing protein n=1 Tax=Seminavis robusta TaxID=568900 RepID=A0A9N8HLE1_9STRA|nr:Pentatricopeptide repeat-containing protein [Seminavis robusta]|eukprot:Sro676_g185630.1 Pentatricopeptide repeat-containing protein (816) ;mRNA; r:14423-16870